MLAGIVYPALFLTMSPFHPASGFGGQAPPAPLHSWGGGAWKTESLN